MRAMNKNFQTSTPIVYEKLLPPPPRRLWAQDSVTEQLYHNKWVKYRNSVEEKDSSWGELDAPRFVDFQDIPETGDSYFEHVEEQKFATPRKTLEKQLPTSEENNNILETFEKCSLSPFGDPKYDDQTDEIEEPGQFDKALDLISNPFESTSKISSSKIDNDGTDDRTTAIPDAPDLRATNNIVIDKQRLVKSKFEKKNQSDARHSTTIEPFSFEVREKFKQEHKLARRERDSAGKELWTGFRANPVPNFVKLREKTKDPPKPPTVKKKSNDLESLKQCNAAEIWKKKAFQPSLTKKVAVRPKPPDLLTAVRARERQRFEEQLRERERQRQAIRQMEEAAKKKREDEEIARLRRELVHKAQPIRKYKMIVPRVEKRPLAEPTTPFNSKRRRKI